MMRLSALEVSFRDGVLAGDTAVLGAFEPGELTEQKRLDVYRNNVFSNYRGALEAVYPAILSLAGDDYFRQAAHRYVQRYPSSSGDIHHYGQEFCDLLSSLPGAADLAYLPDVARLEWFIHEAFHAADRERLDLSRLQGIPSEDYPQLRFSLNPAARLLHSDYPIRRIWQVNLPDYQGDQRVDLSEGGETVLVMRRNFVMEVAPISAAEASTLMAFQRDDNFGDALNAALVIDPDFDVGSFLQRFVLDETIVDFRL
jgi:Putative DNA-binding domain